MGRHWILATTALILAGCASLPQQPTRPRVALETTAGRIVLALDPAAAPISTCNFIGYVVFGDYDNGAFFRTVLRETNTANPHPIDVIQAATPRGSDDDSRPPIRLERTRDTGLRHVAGTVSMARDGPDSATSSFFIVIRDTPSLDFGGARNPDGQGFAAFGQVIEGMDVARRIQGMPANAEEQLTPPVTIRSARLLDAVPSVCTR
ncbi:peptidylprolyl isomerase [Brevundimonas sp. SORGH_AS_0993]|uniref:peptidylprolyl isomerase n=1 Tax=Brevundimonas sp. SORGH_AS_0993 TaxID=3041794 RepID=UPI0027842B33|nr:peptidylprolyl isomerase [Brevundimonas sp. SORGH_AS_0993]MDQ1153579.1 peptidyl-prolyl cis-trans isomerase A (cyclophilin A) [Brevundimonas sp. SORGH_AS_0993]